MKFLENPMQTMGAGFALAAVIDRGVSRYGRHWGR